MDVSAQATMKDAAKCDKLCEWQNSANQQNAERTLHFQVTPESTSESGRLLLHASINLLCLWHQNEDCVCVCQRRFSVDALNIVIDRFTRTPLGEFILYRRSL